MQLNAQRPFVPCCGSRRRANSSTVRAKRFGIEHRAYHVTPDDLVRAIPGVAAHYDQPFGNSSALPAIYCAQMARQDGVSKLLAGDAGDEFVGGNSRYAKQRIFGG